MSARLPWKMLAFVSQSVGFLLLFVGTVLAIFGAGFPISSIASTSLPSQSTLQGIAWAIALSKFLWALGLLGLGGGAGLKLAFHNPSQGSSAEENAVFLARRRGEWWLFVISLGLLFALLLLSWYYASPNAI